MMMVVMMIDPFKADADLSLPFLLLYICYSWSAWHAGAITPLLNVPPVNDVDALSDTIFWGIAHLFPTIVSLTVVYGAVSLTCRA